MAFDVNKYFKVLKFLQDNPIVVSKCRRDGEIHKGKLDFCPTDGMKVDHISLRDYINTESLTNPNKLDLMMDLLDWDPNDSLSLPKEFNVANSSLEARDKIRDFFGRVFVPGSYAYNTKEMDLFRRMSVDWASTARTFKDLMLHASDIFTLDDDDVDKAIRGFGIDFVNKKTLPALISRQFFLLALTDLYKIKGSASSIIKALYHAGLTEATIREYWVERVPNSYKNLQIRGIAAQKYQQSFDKDDKSPTYLQYKWNQNQSLFDDSILSWQNFESRLWDIGEPHWWYTNEEIINIEWDPNVWMKLPSITPYFGISFAPNIKKLDTIIGIIEKLLSSQFNAYLQGNDDLIPREIGVSGFNEDTTRRDIWIDGYAEAITMLEVYTGWVYAQIRYDEYLQYSHLRDFLKSRGIQIIDSEIYTYPWAYQELIYKMWLRGDELVDGVFTIDSILKMYPKASTPYYCATNELIRWWMERPSDPSEPNDPVVHTPTNLPSVFSSNDYSFHYQMMEDRTMDRILYYNGPRNINFHEPNFEYEEAILDHNIDMNQDTYRVEFDTLRKSYHASNRHDEFLKTSYDALYDHLNTYYEYVSWVDSAYNEDVEHDGSSLTPYYVAKYPKPSRWNWAVDSNYLYYCTTPANWVKVPIETSWSETSILPDSPAPNISKPELLGHHIYNDGYVYVYATKSESASWVRYTCNTEWDYCDGPVTPEGYIRKRSRIARTNIKAKIPESIATAWLTDQTSLAKTTFDITFNPLGNNPDTRQYNISQLQEYIQDSRVIVEENGYLLIDFNRVLYNNHIFARIVDINDEVVWIRTPIISKWDLSDNGTKIYKGGYKYPNLDLSNRYDAERILRGNFVLEATDLDGLDGTLNDGEILVSNKSNGDPEIWRYDTTISSWRKDDDNKIGRVPGRDKSIKKINLGFNNKLIEWMDQSVTHESDYGDLADKFLQSFSNYVKISFNDPDLDIAGVYKNIKNAGLYKDLIDFFKPKRARLLYFSLDLIFDNRLHNSIKIYDEPCNSKITQTINDHVPRQDNIFIDSNNSLYKNSYHQDDRIDIFEIPTNEVYGDAVLYLKGFEDDRVNGFYFRRNDLSQDYNICFLNDHNICLIQVNNGEAAIYGYHKEWIIALRKDDIDWCDALYLNYSSNYLTGAWVTPEDNPNTLPSSFSTERKVIEVSNLNQSDLRECDIIKSTDLTIYNSGVENPWNVTKEITDGRILHIPFKNGFEDTVGIHSVTNMGGVISGREGAQNITGHYDGIEAYTEIELGQFTTREDRQLTYSYWFKLDNDCLSNTSIRSAIRHSFGGNNSDNSIHYRSSLIVDSDDKLYLQRISPNHPEWDSAENGIYNYAQGTTIIERNKWYHVIEEVDLDVGKNTLYLNGIVEAIGEWNTDSNSYNDGLRIEDTFIWLGRRKFWGETRNNLKGSIDNFQIHSRILTPAEIKNISKYHRRPTALTTTRKETASLVHFGPAVCKDSFNIRRPFPFGAHGHPENLEGSRYDGYDAAIRSGDPSGNQEFQHSSWRTNPYYDDNVFIHDGSLRIQPKQILNVPGFAAPVLDRSIAKGDVYQSKSFYNNYTPERTQFAIGDGVTTSFKLSILRINAYHINIFIDDIQINDSLWNIDINTVTSEEFIVFNSAPALSAKISFSYSVPVWWIFDPNLFYSGAIHHRPVYLGIMHTVHDCYPCRDWSDCCDYYDTGCRHDGPTNPQMAQWINDNWASSQYADYSLLELEYDEHTCHHKSLGFIDGDIKSHYEDEANWARELDNPGDTWCIPCDDPLFTPDVAVHEMPDTLKQCGIYHNTITATGFTGDLSWINGTWQNNSNGSFYEVEFNSSTKDEDKQLSFKYGYMKSSNEQIKHIYHKDSGYHYWEIERKSDIWRPVARTLLKEKRHTINDIFDNNIGNWHVEPDNYLNGHDIDLVEDRWSDQIVDPSQYTLGDINQIAINGRFETSTWIKFSLVDCNDSFDCSKPGSVGDVDYVPDSSTTGNFYICVKSDYDLEEYMWKKYNRASNDPEHEWSMSEESNIRPDSNTQFYNYYHRNNYLYIFIGTSNHIGWIRLATINGAPVDTSFQITNQWKLDINSETAYRHISTISQFPNQSALDYEPGREEEMSVCGDIVPYNETYNGILAIYRIHRCSCHVKDKVDIVVYHYHKDDNGPYMKIRTDNINDLETRVDHRWIAHNDDPTNTLAQLNDYLQNPTNINIDSIDHYNYKWYIPFNSNLKTWIRDGNDNWNRSVVSPEDYASE